MTCQLCMYTNNCIF